jgi:hypothetical protein
MHLSGYPLIRNVGDLELTTQSFGLPVSADESIMIVTSSLAEGTTLQFYPKYLPASAQVKCGMPCILDFTITMKKERKKTSSFSLFYFSYPQAQMLSVVPTNGPINGGTKLMLTALDFTGPETRQGAGVPNLMSVFTGKMKLKVVFQMDGITWKADVKSDATKGLGVFENSESIQTAGVRAFDICLTLPPSKSFEGLASISFEIDETKFEVDSSQASLDFEYVGTQILYITPNSGLLNPGSGGININVVVLNLPSPLKDLEVKLGNQACAVQTISRSDSELGVASAIACRAPELPLSMVGNVEVE